MARASLIALSISSAITVLPKSASTTFFMDLSQSATSAAIQIIPSFCSTRSSLSSLLPSCDEIGRNVTLPMLFAFKYSIACFACCSVSTTMFCIAFPSAVSTAVVYFFSTVTSLLKTPISAPLYLPSFSAFKSSRTPLAYPSSPRSISSSILSRPCFSPRRFVITLYSSLSCALFLFAS